MTATTQASAADSAYGPPLAAFPYDPDLRKSNTFLGLGFLGLAVLFPVLYVLDPTQVPLPTLGFTPFCLLLGTGVLAWAFLSRSTSLTIYGEGFVYRSPFGTHAVAYRDVASVRYHLVHVLGSISYNRGFFEITLKNGQKIEPSMQLAPMDRAIGAVIEATLPLLAEETIAKLAQGGTVAFGPFELHPQGVQCRGRAVPWARAAFRNSGSFGDICLMDVDPRGEGSTDVHETKSKKVPNTDVLEAVAERMRSEALRSGRW